MSNAKLAPVPQEDLTQWHTVLIVDDDLQTLAALRRLLEREPYDVVTTDRPGLALEWMSRKNVSLVVSDQRMPEMDGDLFLEEVWKKAPHTLRILLTAYPESVRAIPESRRSLLKVMSKPWNDEELKRALRSMLRGRESALEREPWSDLPRA
ncbi:MAG: response regulator [Planctomycetes bacterium]|nr:response regulator [Planctomycetota bacterium]